MSVTDEMIAARDCGLVHCGISSLPSPSLTELAREFDLDGNTGNYREIDAESARKLVRLLLNRDMAYNVEIVPNAIAAELADRFLAQFGTEEVRFYTNGTFHQDRSGTWNPVTPATFDTGVLVLGPRCSGCFWVEDED